MTFNKEQFEKICNEYKFEVDNTVARYLGYSVVLFFPKKGVLSVWLNSNSGFQDADDYDDAVEKVEKSLAYIAKLELEYKKELGRERFRKMETDFG